MRVKNFVLIISIIFFISFTGGALAQTSSATTSINTTSLASLTSTTSTTSSPATVSEESTSTEQEAEEMINKDENVSPSELGVKEPTILPGNPFYFLKDWGHRIRSIFVFNRVKKAELMQRYANEKLLELQKLEEENKNPQVIARATDNYNKALSRLQSYVGKIENASSSQANKFMDEFTRQQMLHQRILDRLENRVSTSTFQKIEEARRKHLEMFKSVMSRLQNEQQIQDRLEKSIKEGKGSALKGIKTLEILKRLEKVMPEQSKDSVKKVEQTVIDKLQENLEKLPPSKQGLLNDYLNKMSGDPEEHMNILQDITTTPKLQRAKERALEGVSNKIEKSVQKRGCPAFEKPKPGFCSQGRVVIKRDEKGCPISFECIPLPETPFKGEYQKQCLFVCLKSSLSRTSTTSTIRKCLSAPLVSPNSTESLKDCLSPIVKPEVVDKCLQECVNFKKERYCPTLWDPVCGENGITYQNSCVAQLAGVKIAHKGRCDIKQKREIKNRSLNETTSTTTTRGHSGFPSRGPMR